MNKQMLFNTTIFILFTSVVGFFPGINLAQNIQHEILSDGVEHWHREHTNEAPWFFKQIETIFNIVLPDRNQLPFGESIAFLVGVSQYEYLSPQLPFVKNDLQDMRTFLLTEGGFDHVYVASEEVVNRTLIEEYMRNKFREEFKTEDRLLFYYAGHGADSGGRTGYMQFSKAQPGNFAGSQVLAINDAEDWAYEVRFRHLLFIFDCCASGLAFTPRGNNEQEYAPIVSALSRNGSRLIITAGTANEKTFEVEGVEGRGNGVFTRAFLNALETGSADIGRDGFITIDEIMAQIKIEVARFASEYEQNITPRHWEFDSNTYRGTFVFVNPKADEQRIVIPHETLSEMWTKDNIEGYRISLFRYHGDEDGILKTGFDQFYGILSSKILTLVQELVDSNPDIDYLEDLHLYRTNTYLPGSHRKVLDYWKQSYPCPLEFLSGTMFSQNEAISVSSKVFFDDSDETSTEQSVEKLHSVNLELKIVPAEFDSTRDSHSLITLYALALDAQRSGLPTHITISYLSEAYSIVQDLDQSIPAIKSLKASIESRIKLLKEGAL